MNEALSNNIKNTAIGTILATFLTTLSYILADWFGWAELSSIDWLVAFAVFTSYLCTWLCVHQTRWNYPVGIVTTAAYSVIFWKAGLFAFSVFNAYLVFSLVYGWFRWGDDDSTRPVTKVEWPWHLGYVALAAGIYGILWVVHMIIGQEMAWYDVVISIASGVAQFLLDNKKVETWLVWILVNVASIALFLGFITDDPNVYQPIVAFQYVFFLANAFFGGYMWWKSYQKDKELDIFDDELKALAFPNHARFPQTIAEFD